MKRGKIICILLLSLILVSAFISADNLADSAKTAASGASAAAATASTQFSGNLADVGRGVDNATEDILQKQVTLPPWLDTPAKVIFGVESGISWQQLVLLLGVWVMMFIFIFSFTSFIPFVNKKILKLIVAIAITSIISLTGTIDFVVKFFLDIGKFLKITSEWPVLNSVIAGIIVVIIIVLTIGITKMLKRRMIVDYAEAKGRQAGTFVDTASKGEREIAEKQ